jgi:pilus assembly protein CpaC
MVVNSSRILTLDKEIPRALVNNTEIVRVVPLSPNQVQVSALTPGVTQINLWDESGDVHSIDVVTFGDARQLEMLLRSEFPHAALRVRPLASSVVLSGFVDRPEIVSRIIRMAEDYYPKVINNITVGGVQQVALHVKVMEVSRTKLRALGFDWALFDGDDFVVQTVSGLLSAATPGGVTTTGSETVSFGVINGDDQFFGVLEALRQNNLVKVLAEPTLIAVSGRASRFKSGGEFPILVPQSLGTLSTEFKEFGTMVDFVPIVLGNGNIRLEVRPQVSELDFAQSVTVSGTTVPGLRERWAETAVEMRAGQTLAIAGLIQTRVEAENRGIPWLADMPWVGAAFRTVRETMNEVELLITVRAELVDALEQHEVPPRGPGQFTTSPKDVDLYWRGYLEVPDCCPDGSCPHCQSGGHPSGPVPSGYPSAPLTAPLTPAGPAGSYESVSPMPADPDSPTTLHAPPSAPGQGAPVPGATSAPANGPAYPVPSWLSTLRKNTDNAPTSSNPPTYANAQVQQGMFGPTGYDNLDY